MKASDGEKAIAARATTESLVESDYLLGHTVEEYERLVLQSRILRPYTERFFRAAGLTAGMRVLDAGCGIGDVALLVADILGPGGFVVGIDRDLGAIERARLRTLHTESSSDVDFIAAEIDGFESGEQFDAVVGRDVLCHQFNPVASIERLLRLLKPGGVVVFHELDFSDSCPSFPTSPTFDRASTLIREAFRLSGLVQDAGRRLGKWFVDAGLPFPTIVSEGVIGGGHASFVYSWVASTLHSVAPRLRQAGLMSPSDVDLDHNLPVSLEEEAVRCGSQLLAPVQFGAWTRKASLQPNVGPTTQEEAERLFAAASPGSMATE